MTLRIVQWTTGNVGKRSVAAIARNPGLELVGCYAWSPDKVGRDVGELCGLDALGVELDDVVCQAEYAKTPTDLDLGSWKIAAGCVAGIAGSWQGRVNGRTLVELNFRWKKAPTLEPDWAIEDGWVIEVQGLPSVRTKVNFLPPPDFKVTQLADFMVLGHIMTAMPAINAIPAVVAARPGIVSYPDLTLPLPRGLVRP